MDKAIVNEMQHYYMNKHISAILEILTSKSSKIDNQEEKLTDLSYKLSTYEYHMDKVIINEMQQPLPPQVKNNQYEKILELLSKLSNYEYLLEKLSTTETQIQPLQLQITEISSKLSAHKNRLDKMSITNISNFEKK